MSLYQKFLLLYSLLFSVFSWFTKLYWIRLFNVTPSLSHLERQERFIEDVAQYYFVNETEQLYTAGVIIAGLGLLNLISIGILFKQLHKTVFTILLAQALVLQLFQVWTIL